MSSIDIVDSLDFNQQMLSSVNDDSIEYIEKDLVRINFENSLKNLVPQITNFIEGENKILLPNILPKILKKKVVVIVIDSLGWLQFKKFYKKNSNIFEEFSSFYGSSIFSVFPSSTAPAISTINLGLKPSENGIYDARMYFSKSNRYIWSFNLENILKNEKSSSYFEENLFFPTVTQWRRCSNLGIEVNMVIPKKVSKSIFNQFLAEGSNLVTYSNFYEGLVNTFKLTKNNEKCIQYVYWEDIDKLSHKYGPNTPHSSLNLKLFFQAISDLTCSGDYDDTAIVITSDHGQINCEENVTVYLNDEIKNFDKYLKDRGNDKVFPVGSGRNCTLFLNQDTKSEIKNILKSKLQGIAKVWDTNEDDISPLFGTSIHKNYAARIGDLIITPYKNNLVWYKHPELGSDKKGTHGGLSKEEVLSTVITLNYK